jgi:hypothetical protein
VSIVTGLRRWLSEEIKQRRKACGWLAGQKRRRVAAGRIALCMVAAARSGSGSGCILVFLLKPSG